MCYNQHLIISISFILHNDTNIYTVFSVNKEHTLWWTVCGLIWNCKQIKCSKVSHIPRRWIGHGLGGDTEALGSAGAFALLLCIYSVNASSCGIVCTQMQGCLMIIASQLHSGAGTEFCFFFLGGSCCVWSGMWETVAIKVFCNSIKDSSPQALAAILHLLWARGGQSVSIREPAASAASVTRPRAFSV